MHDDCRGNNPCMICIPPLMRKVKTLASTFNKGLLKDQQENTIDEDNDMRDEPDTEDSVQCAQESIENVLTKIRAIPQPGNHPQTSSGKIPNFGNM